ELHKYYEALTEGTVPADWQPGQIFNWKSRIHRGKKRAFEAPHGKDALTRATWLRRTEQGLLWRLEPLTGRSHQLRFELTKQGFPILGDQLYGAQTKFDGEGIALRAVELDFSGLADARALGLPEQLLVEGKF
ncbi:MAG: RNA pseudouridine synthase, partial [Bdellovibrionales bacterium]|nr:RNA pseudouridine synthase [Bdellovibrionales bacterium]